MFIRLTVYNKKKGGKKEIIRINEQLITRGRKLPTIISEDAMSAILQGHKCKLEDAAGV